MVKARNKEAYKRTGAESSKLCDINLPESHNNSFANAHYSGTFLHSQNGEHPQQKFFRSSQRNLELPSSEWDHDYCRRFTRKCFFQCGRRSSGTVSNKFQQIETKPSYFQKDLQSLSHPRHKPFFRKNITTNTGIHS